MVFGFFVVLGFYVPNEENLASAVVDIRLIDQQKQNVALEESVNRLQNELSAMQSDALKLYSTIIESQENAVESPSIGKILSEIGDKCSNLKENNAKLTKEIEMHCGEIATLKKEENRFKSELAENETTINSMQISMDLLKEKLESATKANEELMGTYHGVQVELETTKTALVACEEKRNEFEQQLTNLKEELEKTHSEKREQASKHYEELRAANLEHDQKLNALQGTLDIYIKEEDVLNQKLNDVQTELKQTQNEVEKKRFLMNHLLDVKLDLERRLWQTEKTNVDVVAKCERLETELTAVYKSKMALESDVEKYKQLNSELDGQLQNVGKELEDQKGQVTQLKSEIEQFEAKIAVLQNVSV